MALQKPRKSAHAVATQSAAAEPGKQPLVWVARPLYCAETHLPLSFPSSMGPYRIHHTAMGRTTPAALDWPNSMALPARGIGRQRRLIHRQLVSVGVSQCQFPFERPAPAIKR